MLAPLISDIDARGIIDGYSASHARARTPAQREELFKLVIRSFRRAAYSWHVEPKDLAGKRCYYIVEHSYGYRVRWLEVARAHTIQVRNGTAIVRARGVERAIPLHRVLAFEKRRQQYEKNQ